MRSLMICSISFVWVIGFAISSASAADPAPGKQVEQRFEYAKNPRHSMGYLVYLPAKHGSSDEKFPLIFFLHGSGERGNYLPLVKKHGPPRICEERRDFPFIVVSPQLSADNQFYDPQALAALLDSIVDKYSIDKDRIYLTGLSMGGGGSWHLAALQPDRFAAVAPICGWTDPRDAVKMKNLAIWTIHGDADGAVPFMETEQMVDALRNAGADVKFTIHHGGGHDTWTSTYDSPEFYEWLLRHRRRGAST